MHKRQHYVHTLKLTFLKDDIMHNFIDLHIGQMLYIYIIFYCMHLKHGPAIHVI